MDDSIIPPMPAYLKSKNRSKPKKIKKIQSKWVVPEPKETRQKRRQTKIEHDNMVLAAVRSGADTFAKIRKELNNALETNEISNSIRRNRQARRITKRGRRYYTFGH